MHCLFFSFVIFGHRGQFSTSKTDSSCRNMQIGPIKSFKHLNFGRFVADLFFPVFIIIVVIIVIIIIVIIIVIITVIIIKV